MRPHDEPGWTLVGHEPTLRRRDESCSAGTNTVEVRPVVYMDVCATMGLYETILTKTLVPKVAMPLAVIRYCLLRICALGLLPVAVGDGVLTMATVTRVVVGTVLAGNSKLSVSY
jgi:hypothetical protein